MLPAFTVRSRRYAICLLAPDSWLLYSLHMLDGFQNHLEEQLQSIRTQGLFKTERLLSTPPRAHIRTADGKAVLNFCATNYLGLAYHPPLIDPAPPSFPTSHFALSSVRFT